MKNKKYILTEETMEFKGRTLHRIKAIRNFGKIKEGQLGGWIEKEFNLSHEGNCWIYEEAKAMDNSRICDNARMFDEAVAFDNVKMFDDTTMYGNTVICNNAEMYDNATMYNSARMYDYTRMHDNTKMHDNATMYGQSEMHGYTEMFDDSEMHDRARMYGYSKMCSYSVMTRNATLKEYENLYGTLRCKVDKFVEIHNPQGKLVTGVLINGEIFYNVGKKRMLTKESFTNEIYEGNKGRKNKPCREGYLKIINMIEMYLI